MPPPVISVVETGSTMNLPSSIELEVVAEEPTGRLGAKEVRVADDEGCWCCGDLCGCDSGRFYCSKFSFSSSSFCCCLWGATAAGAAAVVLTVDDKKISDAGKKIFKESISQVKENTVDFVEDMKSNLTPTAMQPVFPTHSPPSQRKPPRPPPPQVVKGVVNVVYLDVGDSLS